MQEPFFGELDGHRPQILRAFHGAGVDGQGHPVTVRKPKPEALRTTLAPPLASAGSVPWCVLIFALVRPTPSRAVWCDAVVTRSRHCYTGEDLSSGGREVTVLSPSRTA